VALRPWLSPGMPLSFLLGLLDYKCCTGPATSPALLYVGLLGSNQSESCLKMIYSVRWATVAERERCKQRSRSEDSC